MAWTFRISLLLFLALIGFIASPFVALFDLARAVEARDLARIEERVNFRALRMSLSRQIAGAYLGARDLGGLDRQAAAGAGSVVLNPVVEELVTPEALMDLLSKGWPQQGSQVGSGSLQPVSARLDFRSAEELLRIFVMSESQGFRAVIVPLPADQPRDKQFRVTLRLSGATWRLTGLDLPQDLRKSLIARASRAERKALREPKLREGDL
ncbi:DUF2939 domain-containing protein [Microvirga roseola]|uniref:DUF2939 domain-containing protein n=1 Tax=Microvirga roseola TaxID=2883126 RepID=UPI001E53779A|nr:DUF2939 domain-containing protein [Microvirga roseola]